MKKIKIITLLFTIILIHFFLKITPAYTSNNANKIKIQFKYTGNLPSVRLFINNEFKFKLNKRTVKYLYLKKNKVYKIKLASPIGVYFKKIKVKKPRTIIFKQPTKIYTFYKISYHGRYSKVKLYINNSLKGIIKNNRGKIIQLKIGKKYIIKLKKYNLEKIKTFVAKNTTGIIKIKFNKP